MFLCREFVTRKRQIDQVFEVADRQSDRHPLVVPGEVHPRLCGLGVVLFEELSQLGKLFVRLHVEGGFLALLLRESTLLALEALELIARRNLPELLRRLFHGFLREFHDSPLTLALVEVVDVVRHLRVIDLRSRRIVSKRRAEAHLLLDLLRDGGLLHLRL